MAGVPLLLHQQREARVRAGLATQLAGAINKEVVQRAARARVRCADTHETANPAQFCTVGAVPRLYMYREE